MEYNSRSQLSFDYKAFRSVGHILYIQPICYPDEGSPALIAESFTRTPRFLLFGFAPSRDAQKLFANLFACRLFVEDNGSKWARPKVARCYSELNAMNLGWHANHQGCAKVHNIAKTLIKGM